MRNKKLIYRSMVCSLGILSLLGILWVSIQSTSISAKPSGTPIIIDKKDPNVPEEGPDYSFELPNDATKLVEEDLINNSQFDGFVQNEDIVTNFKKETKFIGYNSIPNFKDSFEGKFIQVPNKEEYIIQVSISNSPTNGTILLVKVDSNGNYISKFSLADLSVYGSDWQPVNKNLQSPSTWFISNVTNIELSDGKGIVYYSQGNGTNNGYVKKYVYYNLADFKVLSKGIASGWGVGYTNGSGYGSVGPVSASNKDAALNGLDGKPKDRFQIPALSDFGSSKITTGRIEFGVNRLHSLSDGSVGGTFTYSDKGFLGNGEEAIIWDEKNGDLPRQIKNRFGLIKGKNTHFQIIAELSSDKEVYYQYTLANEFYKIVKYSIATNTFTVIRSFEAGTSLKFFKKGNEISFIGYVPILPNNNIKEATIAGVMDVELNILSVSNIPSNVPLDFLDIVGLYNEKFLTIGNTIKKGNFIDEWVGQDSNAVFLGVLRTIPDYSPIIESPSSISLNLDIFKNEESSIKESILLSKDGGKQAIRVYDEHDINKSLNPISEQEFQKRLNRNPKDITLPIDWKSLGFDEDNTGPQRVTYFVTDSQKQATATSRIINAKTGKTKEKDNYFLDANNFSLPLTDVSTLTEKAVKIKAKTKAWNGNLEDEFLDEDATKETPFLSSKVTFPMPDQLKAIQETKKVGVYPLDIEYKGADAIKVSNRIWVFVTDKNTVVDKENNIVMYANDYYRPVHEAKNENAVKMWGYTPKTPAEGETPAVPEVPGADIKVYNYKATEQTGDTLPMLADKDKTTYLSVNEELLTAIRETPSPLPNGETSRNYPAQISYTANNKTTTASITVTLGQELTDVTIRFVDEDGTSINANVILKDRQINSTIDLLKEQAITDVNKVLVDSKNYEQKIIPETYKVQVENNEVTYIFKGLLRLVDVSEELTFQQGYTSPNDQVLEYESSNDFVVNVGDYRNYTALTGEEKRAKQRGNFSISVALSSPFRLVGSDGQPMTKVLSEALLNYTPKNVVEPLTITPEGVTIHSSTQSTEDPKKTDFSLKLDEKNKTGRTGKGWSLFVPSKKVQKGTYQAELTWSLTTGP
ncbi:hypothetical protein IGJ02_002624 [Enterococcus sp. DIV0724b]|uniref:hypothetical protein n=1 Tax=Enterococcus sp. DIV0724b TaxID=2774694 RepID=UPI003D2FC67D